MVRRFCRFRRWLASSASSLVQAGASLLDTYLEHARFVQHQAAEWEDGDESGLHTLLLRAGIYPLDVLRVSIMLLVLGGIAGIPLVASGGYGSVGSSALAGYSRCLPLLVHGAALKRYPVGDLLILLALGPGIVALV